MSGPSTTWKVTALENVMFKVLTKVETFAYFWVALRGNHNMYRICRNKRPGRLIFRSKKHFSKPIKSHRFCVLPPLKTSPIKAHWFCVLPPLKSHCFWWALISGWAFISANTVLQKYSKLIIFQRTFSFFVEGADRKKIFNMTVTTSAPTEPTLHPHSDVYLINWKFN